jgi:hypothetical protein
MNLQALMLPYVRTQDAITDEVAYFFSSDMIIEVNTVRGMRVLAYVLFDTLVQHVQYLETANANSAASLTKNVSPRVQPAAGGGGKRKVASAHSVLQSAVESDSLTFEQWNSCFDDRGQAQRARKMIFASHQLATWRENKTNRVIRRQDFVQAYVFIAF